jgi:hypothetical protein
MQTFARILVVTAAFGLLGPPVGLTVFLAGVAASQGFRFDSINWSDFSYSVLELGLPAAAAGVVFCGITFFWPPRFRRPPIHRRALLAGLTMSLIFGIPLAEKLFVYRHFSPTWAVIALAAGVTGLIIGSLIPPRLLVRNVKRNP